jgi:hypothetical protein
LILDLDGFKMGAQERASSITNRPMNRYLYFIASIILNNGQVMINKKR